MVERGGEGRGHKCKNEERNHFAIILIHDSLVEVEFPFLLYYLSMPLLASAH